MSFPHFYLQEREVNIVSSSSEEIRRDSLGGEESAGGGGGVMRDKAPPSEGVHSQDYRRLRSWGPLCGTCSFP